MTDGKYDQMEKDAAMKEQGLLPDAEFEQEKKKILGGGADASAPGSGNKNKVSWGCIGCLAVFVVITIVGLVGSTCGNRDWNKALAPAATPASLEKQPDAHAKDLIFDSTGGKVLEIGIRYNETVKKPLTEITYGRDPGHQIVIRLMPMQLEQGKEYDSDARGGELMQWDGKYEGKRFCASPSYKTFTKLKVLKLDLDKREAVFGVFGRLSQFSFSKELHYLNIKPLKITVSGDDFDNLTRVKK